MNARRRFLETLRSGKPDRVPLFDEGMRETVLDLWQSQELISGESLNEMFHFDQREEISLELESSVDLKSVSKMKYGLDIVWESMVARQELCEPVGWRESINRWSKRDHVLMLMVHWGFFETLGVSDWNTFYDVVYLLADEPEFVHSVMQIQGEFAANLTKSILQEVEVDAVLFSEPIGGNHGSLISPKMYRDIGMAGYRPILDVLPQFGVDILIWRTYANTRILLPVVVEMGINCLWACECNPEAMDYLDIRNSFGSNLGLIGGIDLDVIRKGKPAIKKELHTKIEPLLLQGRYIPLADGRVRVDIPYENYVYYRQMLEEMIMGRKYATG